MALLAPELVHQLEQLQLSSRYRLGGQLAGEHRSKRYGNALDFADFREYVPGDDFRRIDYHVLARLDTLLIKLYESDDDLVVRLLLDTSASMGVHGKLRQAQRLAAALGVVALTSNDSVVVHAFPSAEPPRRFTSRRSIPDLLAHLETASAGGLTPFTRAAGELLARPGPPGITVVLSDLMTDDWKAAVTRLRSRGADLVIAHVLADEELRPDLVGDFDLIDSESGEYTPVSLSPAGVNEYRQRVEGWLREVEQRAGQVGATYLRVDADADLAQTLLTAWRRQGVLR